MKIRVACLLCCWPAEIETVRTLLYGNLSLLSEEKVEEMLNFQAAFF